MTKILDTPVGRIFSAWTSTYKPVFVKRLFAQFVDHLSQYFFVTNTCAIDSAN